MDGQKKINRWRTFVLLAGSVVTTLVCASIGVMIFLINPAFDKASAWEGAILAIVPCFILYSNIRFVRIRHGDKEPFSVIGGLLAIVQIGSIFAGRRMYPVGIVACLLSLVLYHLLNVVEEDIREGRSSQHENWDSLVG